MSKESAIRFLKELRTNEKAKELLQGLKIPESKEDKIKVCAKIAADLGEDVSYEDLADALEEIEAGIRHKAEAASSDIAEFPLRWSNWRMTMLKMLPAEKDGAGRIIGAFCFMSHLV